MLRVQREQLLQFFTAQLFLSLLGKSFLILGYLRLQALLRAHYLLHHAQVVCGVLFVEGLYDLKHAGLLVDLGDVVNVLVKDRKLLIVRLRYFQICC